MVTQLAETPGAGGPGRVRLVAVDLNGTLLGNPEATSRFAAAWHRLDGARRPHLVYACGRSVAEMQDVVNAQKLPQPTAMIGGLGTSLAVAGHQGQAREFNARFVSWKPALIDELFAGMTGLVREAASFLHPYPSRWHWRHAAPGELARLRSRLAEAGIEAAVLCANRHSLEIIPAGTSKGLALRHLCALLAVPLEAVVVAGDTLHDASMMLLPQVKRIVVENSLPELEAELVGLEKFLAPLGLADGVVDGLRYFGVLPRREGGA
jgi:hydroxymethylpyrimidine pyrophosphatase-like HAD family hydrolase